MEEAQRVGVSPDVVALMNPVPALRARLLLARGAIDAAADWVAERGLAVDQPNYPRELEYLVLARVLLAQQVRPNTRPRADAAQSGIEPAADEQPIELQVLEALALAAGGDESAALPILSEALGPRSRRATSVSSSTRARRWPNWWANSLLPS